jgi:hypothetical protein
MDDVGIISRSPLSTSIQIAGHHHIQCFGSTAGFSHLISFNSLVGALLASAIHAFGMRCISVVK